jgi:hypothetical protein
MASMSEILVKVSTARMELKLIEKKVYELTGISIKDRKRGTKQVQARTLFYKVAIENGHKLVETGRHAGFDHSTVIHCIYKVHPSYMQDYEYELESSKPTGFSNKQYQEFYYTLTALRALKPSSV